MRGRSLWGSLFVTAVFVACSPSDGDGHGDGAGDGGTNGDGGTVAPDAAPSLGCPSGCLAPAPEGWHGPSAVYDGAPAEKPAACPPQYDVAELETYQGLAPTPAVCSCGTPTFESKAPCKTVVEYWSEPACKGFSVTSDGSYPFTKCIGPSVGFDAMFVHPPVYENTCSFGTPSKTLPPPVFDKTQVVCGLAAPAACSDRPECTGAPTPDGPFARMCIYKDGESACPSQDYAVRFVAHRGTTDDRDCTPCGEGTATGTCGNTITSWTGGDCTGMEVPMTTGTCSEDLRYVDLTKGTDVVSATCEPEPGGNQPTGALALKDPVTFCCNQ